MNIDVSTVINFHKEGRIARNTLESVMRAKAFAEQQGIRVEIICILDRPDHRTQSLVARYALGARIVTADFGDLAKARNLGIDESRGKYITFIDGDDLWGKNWIASGYRHLESLQAGKFILHPKVNMYFGREIEPYYWIHPDMRYEKIDLCDIACANRWTALSFAQASIYREFKFVPADLSQGFGYEDWSWNFMTVKEGFLHIALDDGIHFIRKKKFGSLVQESVNSLALPLIAPFCRETSVDAKEVQKRRADPLPVG